MKRLLGTTVILLLLGMRAFCADVAQIMAAEGSAFTLIREGTSYAFDLVVDDVRGMTLYRGDTIMTEADTFLEIHLLKGSTMLKIAGGSTITIEQLDKEGGGVIRVGYGRVRARVSGLSSRGEFYLITATTVAGFRGKAADFGIDYLYLNTGKTDPAASKDILTRIYSFEGEIPIALFPEGTEARGKKMDKPQATVSLNSGEMLELAQSDQVQTPEKKVVTAPISQFWKEHPFGRESKVVRTDEDISDSSVANMTWTISNEENYPGRMRRAGAYTFGIGAGVVSLGLLVSLFMPPDQRITGYAFAGFGGGISLMGAGLVGTSYLLPGEEGALREQ